MLKIKNLSFSFGALSLFESLDLEIEKGESVALLGPSGSGKTTLFHLIAGLLKPTFGEIFVEQPLTYMMQEDVLLPWRSALSNLLILDEFEGENREGEARSLLQEVGLKGFEKSYPAKLSGGMRQRVSLARALFQKRPFLILDEPFGAIDTERRFELYELIKNLQRKYNLTLLFITHDPRDAENLSTRILNVKNRRLSA